MLALLTVHKATVVYLKNQYMILKTVYIYLFFMEPSFLLYNTQQHFLILTNTDSQSLCKKCPNTEFFLVRIFPHLDLIRRDTDYLSVFSPNAGKHGPEKLRIWPLFTQ